jgi:hypothetical protein
MKSDSFELYGSHEVGITRLGNEIKTYKKTYTAKDYTPWLFKTEA